MAKKSSLVYLVGVFALAVLFSVMLPGHEAPTLLPPTVTAASPAAWPDLLGTWAGTWTDTVFNVNGPMTIMVWQEGVDFAAAGTIDVSALGLGTLTGAAAGFDDGTTLTVNFSCTDLGNGTLALTQVKSVGNTLASSGAGSGTVTAPLSFGSFLFDCLGTAVAIGGSFHFTSPGSGAGKVQMTKLSVPVQEQSWGSLKAGYRAY